MCICEQSKARLYLSKQILPKRGWKGMGIAIALFCREKKIYIYIYIPPWPDNYLKKQIFLRDSSKCNFCIIKHLPPSATNTNTKIGIPLALPHLGINQVFSAFVLLNSFRKKCSNMCSLIVLLQCVKSKVNSYGTEIVWLGGPLLHYLISLDTRV